MSWSSSFFIKEDGDNLRPNVTIIVPEPGQVYVSEDGGTVIIELAT